ncbi:MAG: DUF1570 domain-containing protein [Pirellulales bacterium]|nr:DUF1570 domain-containing protein [Pirellulales bacterium]
MQRTWRSFVCSILATALGGCVMWRAKSIALPDKNQVPLEQLTIHSDFELPREHRLLQEIDSQRVDVSNQLNLPVSSEAIHVYLFKEGEQYHQFIRQVYPNLPERRAFFIETDTRLTVFAHWGDRVAEDLRHEVAHGYLHAVLTNLPLWLDEGLAEYFEVPRGAHGLNPSHVAELNRLALAGRWRPDIRRLETFRSPAEMSQADYAESWAWVHWMLATTPERKTLLQEFLADLRRTGTATPLSPSLRRLEDNPERQLAEHVQSLAQTRTR